MNIVITADFSQEGIDRLKKAGHSVKYICWGPTHHICDENELIKDLQGSDVLIVGYEPITRDVLEKTDLKIICSIRGGPGANIDLAYATERGIPVIFTLGREAIPVADFTMGQIIGLVRQIVKTDRELRRGIFTAPDKEYGSSSDVIWDMSEEGPWESRKGIELLGKTLGLIGFGTVGQEVAKRARAFSMNVIAYDPYQKDHAFIVQKVEKVSKEDLFKRSDIVSIHARATEDNKGMVGAAEFSSMKRGSYFINNARASMVDEKAMRDALDSGQLAGVALDVFHSEPVRENDPLMKMDNTILTPHIAGAGFEVVYRHSDMLIDDLFALLNGEPPKAIINPETISDLNKFKNMGGGISNSKNTNYQAASSSNDIVEKISQEVIRQLKTSGII